MDAILSLILVISYAKDCLLLNHTFIEIVYVQVDLDENTLKRTEFECHSMTYYTLLKVTIGLRNAANYLLMVCDHSKPNLYN